MKVIETGQAGPTLDELITLAREEAVFLRQPDGSLFALAQVDDFEVEVDQLRNNAEFMAYLRRLSLEEATVPIEQLRRELVP